jgi:hypothetical protein
MSTKKAFFIVAFFLRLNFNFSDDRIRLRILYLSAQMTEDLDPKPRKQEE